MTAASHQSGTDRLAEVAASLDCDVVVNVQGDEPLLAPETIDAAVAPFATRSRARDEHAAPPDRRRGRAPEPERHESRRRSRRLRDVFLARPDPVHAPGQPAAPAWAHIGLYVYRRETLLRLAALPPTAMERAEALEQLRALEHGIRIKAVETTHDTIGVDTPRRSRARARAARTTARSTT